MAHFSTVRFVATAAVTFLLALSVIFSAIPQAAHAEGLGSQIVCLVFSELNQVGSPLPFLEADGCPDESEPVPACGDGIDNDADGLVDFPSDPGCENSGDTTESPNPIIEPPVIPTACLDGIDNDSDGLIDWSALEGGDPGCTSPLDEDESNTPPPPPPPAAACADGLDNDGDELTDYPADLGCADAADTDEADATPPPPPPAAACADGIDNDEDELTDYPADPGCSSAVDTDETNEIVTPPAPPVGGGGGGGGGGGVFGGGVIQQVGQVLGVATVAAEPRVCDPYLKTFIKLGRVNDRDDVGRLQSFLNEFEGASLEVTNEYDQATFTAVKAFQNKYLGEILVPWGINAPTGYVYLTTRKKINEIHCDASFPLSPSEEEEITRFRGSVLGSSQSAVATKAVVPITEPISEVTTDATPTVPPETTGILGRVRSFFDRLFGRAR